MSFETLWKVAVADAKLAVDPLLLAFPGPPPPDVGWARHFPPSSTVGHASLYGLDEVLAVNNPATLVRHRVLLYIHDDERVRLGLARHELQHVDQAHASLAVYKVAEVLRDSLAPVYWPLHLAGSAAIYNALPNERDANRASSRLVTRRFGEPDATLRFGDHGSLFREPPAETGDALGCRLLAFASLHPQAFDQEVARRGRDLAHTLDALHTRGSRVWPLLATDEELADLRRRVQTAIPSRADVAAVGARPAAAWQSVVDTLLAGERRALDVINGVS